MTSAQRPRDLIVPKLGYASTSDTLMFVNFRRQGCSGYIAPCWRLVSDGEDPQPLGDHHKLGQGHDLHLFHDLLTVGLDRPLGRAQLARDFLVHLPPHDAFKHLSFARAKMSDQGPQRPELLMVGVHGADAG